MTKTRTLKFGSTTTIRFNIPTLWDIDSLSEIAVSVTNKPGEVLYSGTLTLYTSTTLGSAVTAESTSIVLAAESDDLAPGDIIRIGSDGEIPEVRRVHSYTAGTLTAEITPELEFAHASGADVIGMWGTFELDLSDSDDFPNASDIWIRFTPDSADPAEVNQYRIEKDAFASSDLWAEFTALYPTEWTMIEARDLEMMERAAIKRIGQDLRKKEMSLDTIQDSDLVQTGLILKIRMMAVDSGDMSEFEYNKASKEYQSWLDGFAREENWDDKDGDHVEDEDETTPMADFFASQRFF
jgi:hypothetical protein